MAIHWDERHSTRAYAYDSLGVVLARIWKEYGEQTWLDEDHVKYVTKTAAKRGVERKLKEKGYT